MSVVLVGAGPGAADLLTLRAAAVLAAADVVVHDRLVGDDVLKLLADRTLRIDVGKIPGGGDSQHAINELLIDLARDYEYVVRLKGGDPFVFGRGGEEVVALRAAGIDVEVVPGLSSAFSAPLLAGVPVTHRGLSRGVCVVTAVAEGGVEVDFRSLALPELTLVVLMGVARRASLAAQLCEGGLSRATPVAVVERAATSSQRVLRTVLGELAEADVSSPAVIVIGAVAALELASAQIAAQLGAGA